MMHLGTIGTLSGHATPSDLFCLSSEKGSTLKERICSHKKASRKSQKLYKLAVSIPVLPVPYKPVATNRGDPDRPAFCDN